VTSLSEKDKGAGPAFPSRSEKPVRVSPPGMVDTEGSMGPGTSRGSVLKDRGLPRVVLLLLMLTSLYYYYQRPHRAFGNYVQGHRSILHLPCRLVPAVLPVAICWSLIRFDACINSISSHLVLCTGLHSRWSNVWPTNSLAQIARLPSIRENL